MNKKLKEKHPETDHVLFYSGEIVTFAGQEKMELIKQEKEIRYIGKLAICQEIKNRFL